MTLIKLFIALKPALLASPTHSKMPFASTARSTSALAALRRCADTGCVFEINTGGMFRGYRDTPYPAVFLLEELARLGARVTVSADAHETRALRFEFGPALELLQKAGFSSVAVWENGRFVDKLLPKV